MDEKVFSLKEVSLVYVKPAHLASLVDSRMVVTVKPAEALNVLEAWLAEAAGGEDKEE